MCPLPWLEEAEDVQYNFDDVFIPLRTIDIPIQQKDGDQSGPTDERSKKSKTGDPSTRRSDLPEALGNRREQKQIDDFSEPSDSSEDEEQTDNLFGPSEKMILHRETRYTYDNTTLLYNIYKFFIANNCPYTYMKS